MAKKGSILLNLAGLGPLKCKKIIENLPDINNLLEIKNSQFTNFSFLTLKEIQQIIKIRDSRLFSDELEAIAENKFKVIDIFDDSYPYLLKQISSPPLLLYLKGNVELLKNYSLAIVGTRAPSEYGKRVAFSFSAQLADFGFTVVSGLARGIDTEAHKGAIRKSASTIAVLGSGLNKIYPLQNKALAKHICQEGLLISEYPINTPPLAKNFPQRNRIISGLSQGVLVVEAAARSGALITANFALSQNREVFAVPGNISQSQSKGPHSLIKEGARLIDSVEDILDEINIPGVEVKG